LLVRFKGGAREFAADDVLETALLPGFSVKIMSLFG
jgi:hypothetical protein